MSPQIDRRDIIEQAIVKRNRWWCTNFSDTPLHLKFKIKVLCMVMQKASGQRDCWWRLQANLQTADERMYHPF
jgi:hypothetical protein